jgi:hypothetical protein
MAPAKPKKAGNGGLLHGARVYLSGPMDFVANREDEKTNGWRARIGNVLSWRRIVRKRQDSFAQSKNAR